MLLEAGLTRHEISLLAQKVDRPKRGVLALRDCRRDFLAAIMHNSVLTCASAAQDYGLWLRNAPARLHLGCDHGYSRDRGGSAKVPRTFHRGLRYPKHHTLPLAAVEDVIIHALGCLPENVAIPLVASAVRAHGLRPELLEDDLIARKSGPALKALRKVDLRVESLPEAEALLFLLPLAAALGVEVQAQAFIPGIGRVDFLIAGFLIVEIDGVAYHSDRASVRRDRHRNNASTLKGYITLRYLPEEIWNESERVAAEIQAVLTGRVL
jgi:very-short-patch-repair endonuclease